VNAIFAGFLPDFPRTRCVEFVRDFVCFSRPDRHYAALFVSDTRKSRARRSAREEDERIKRNGNRCPHNDAVFREAIPPTFPPGRLLDSCNVIHRTLRSSNLPRRRRH